MSRRVVPVSTLVHYLKEYLDSDPVLHGVMIEGEISNLRKPYSGHWYFSIKDEKASLPCVMFSSANRRVSFDVKNGDKVVLKGDVTVYESEGRMQMLVSAMQPSGIGDLYLRLEALKKKLSAEGYFDAAHKKPIPPYPMNIALVTGNHTAAREDALITLKKRWPVASLYEYPCPVQGMDAAPRIIEALQKADTNGHEIILLVRGGGSLEDLWCFNDENLARCIYDLHTPLITGIGHEIDFTIADYVADLRANTPTGAVEAAVPDIMEVKALLNHYRVVLETDIFHKLKNAREQQRRMESHPVFLDPQRLFAEKAMHLDYMSEKLMHFTVRADRERVGMQKVFQRFERLMHSHTNQIQSVLQLNETRMIQAMKHHKMIMQNSLSVSEEALKRNIMLPLADNQKRLSQSAALLDAYSPLKILSRGYSITMKDDHALVSVDEVNKEDNISIRLSDGTVYANVYDKEKNNGRNPDI